jgi:hypothetical protein
MEGPLEGKGKGGYGGRVVRVEFRDRDEEHPELLCIHIYI